MSELKLISINDCCDILDNQRIPLNEEQRAGIKGNIPYYGANGVQGYIDKYIFDEPLILLAEDGGNFDDFLNKPIAYRITGKSWVNNHAHVLRVKDEYDYAYVFYSLQHKNITSFIKGGTRAKLNQSELKQITIWDAPYTVQKKIGVLLQALDKEIDAGQELINKYKLIKLGMMSDLFSRGIDPATGLLRPSISEAPELYRDTPIGSLPREWDVLPASLVCERVIDCKNRTPPERDEGFAVIKTFNIKDGEFVFDTLTFTDRLSFDIWTARGVPSPGDIVITREAPVGESFLIEEDMPQLCLGQRTMLYRPDPNVIESEFMYFATRSPRFQKRLLDMAGGSTVGHVRVGDVKDMLFPIPSSVEQKAIAKNCTAINMKLRVEKAMLDKLKAHKAGLMRDLLTGKVPVSA